MKKLYMQFDEDEPVVFMEEVKGDEMEIERKFMSGLIGYFLSSHAFKEKSYLMLHSITSKDGVKKTFKIFGRDDREEK